jgi:hypothetical protein
MTVTDDIRAAKRARQFHSARDFETSSSQIGDVDDPGEEIKRKARTIVAANAKGRSRKAQVVDATLLMEMLGVYPGQDFDPTAPTALLRHPQEAPGGR